MHMQLGSKKSLTNFSNGTTVLRCPRKMNCTIFNLKAEHKLGAACQKFMLLVQNMRGPSGSRYSKTTPTIRRIFTKCEGGDVFSSFRLAIRLRHHDSSSFIKCLIFLSSQHVYVLQNIVFNKRPT